MPAQKRSLSENLDDEEHHQHHAKQSRPEREDEDGEEEEEQQQDEEKEVEEEEEEVDEEGEKEEEEDDDDDDDDEVEDKRPQQKQRQEEDEEDEEDEEEAEAQAVAVFSDSEGSPSSSSLEKPEFVFVQLADIRKEVQCPICLGIIKKTRTVMECLHRFCRECIDKSMRLGNNECPACRTHCASRRSLRDDPKYDTLISALYPDIEKYEKEELAFHEEEKTRNKQIQASIAQIVQRQSEALVKRRTLGRDSASPFMTRSQRNNRITHPRRRNCRGNELQGSEDNEDENDNKDSSSADERCTEVRQRRRKRWAGTRSSQPSSSAANSDGGCIENDLEVSRENRGISPGLVWNPELLAWGRAGTRSHTRHGNPSGCNSKSSQNTRLSKLVDYLRSLEENNELDVHLMLISLDKQSTPSLQQPHLCCRPSLSVKHLCEYIARQTPLEAEEIEILAIKVQEAPGLKADHILEDADDPDRVPMLVDPCKDQLQILEERETVAGLKANCISTRNHLVLVYRRKETS